MAKTKNEEEIRLEDTSFVNLKENYVATINLKIGRRIESLHRRWGFPIRGPVVGIRKWGIQTSGLCTATESRNGGFHDLEFGNCGDVIFGRNLTGFRQDSKPSWRGVGKYATERKISGNRNLEQLRRGKIGSSKAKKKKCRDGPRPHYVSQGRPRSLTEVSGRGVGDGPPRGGLIRDRRLPLRGGSEGWQACVRGLSLQLMGATCALRGWARTPPGPDNALRQRTPQVATPAGP
ncbi:hypothetical protein BT69DRAFT_1322363 [Atractiella rhizophila]|nr:hypothetical protein BT69DRAFT_1322363 [Atractiella rhizophila]